MYNLYGDNMNMYEELEIEFKSLLDKDEFDALVKKFELTENFVKQHNYYFDTVDEYILKNNSSFRIRLRNDEFTLTYKTRKSTNSVIEKSVNLTYDRAMYYLENGYCDDIIDVDLPELFHYRTLMTERASFKINGGIIFIDKSFYSNLVDYEIEFECSDENVGKDLFVSFLRENSITLKESTPKMVRAYNT